MAEKSINERPTIIEIIKFENNTLKFNEIKLFKKSKIYKEMYGEVEVLPYIAYISLSKMWCLLAPFAVMIMTLA